MHYYKRNLGDYAKKCGRLSMLEHGAYTLLIDSCYDREQFPMLSEAIDWCWARSEAEIDAVKFVLSKFFTHEGTVYVQKRIREELDEYHAKAVKNKEIATEREEKRRARARDVNEPLPQQNEATPNHKPITNNQEPRTKEKTTPEGFLAFWEKYPNTERKGAKSKCQELWLKYSLEKQKEEILAHLGKMVLSASWSEGGGKFVPAPLVYLNGRKWDGADIGANDGAAASMFAGAI
jgi:uncharacterized protein YdaU (DUF1376 family)